MTKRQTGIKAPGTLVVVGFGVLMLFMSACVQRQLSAQQKEQLIQRLEMAKQRDEKVAAADDTSNPVEARDARVQAYKADRRARDLEHGFAVSQLKLEHSLEIPPTSLSHEQKAELLEKLKHAKQLDEQGKMYSAEDDSQASQDVYDEHEQQVNRVIKSLEIGEDVSWSRIQSALHVPENP